MTVTNFDRLEGIPEGEGLYEHADLSISATLDTWDHAEPFERLAVGALIAGGFGNVYILGAKQEQEPGLLSAPLVLLVTRELTFALTILAARQLVAFVEDARDAAPKNARQTAENIKATIAYMEGGK